MPATKRTCQHEVDMVCDEHQSAFTETFVNHARRVGQHKALNAHGAERAHGKSHLVQRIPFIEVEAALHGGNRHLTADAAFGETFEVTDDQPSRMSFYC